MSWGYRVPTKEEFKELKALVARKTVVLRNKGGTEMIELNEREKQLEAYMNLYMRLVHETAKRKGWWDTPREDGTLIALMHSELSEALEALREHKNDDKITDMKGVTVELADCVIRIMDYCEARGYDLAGAILAKMRYNEGRPHRHGGKAF